jgi:hypothetical protein
MHACWKRLEAARHSAMSSALCSSSSALNTSEMARCGALEVCDMGLASRWCELREGGVCRGIAVGFQWGP